MWSTIRTAICVGMVVALSGCAGTNFIKPDTDSLKNGQTNYAQVTARMGPPRREGSIIKNDQTLKTTSYAYAAAAGKPLHDGVTAARAIGFYFYNDILVGYEFTSSWAEDNTDFDDTKIPGIVRGKTTRAEVLQLMGKPGGYYIYPMIKPATGEAAAYVFSETKGGAFNLKFYRKVLIVTFDTAGVVSDVDFTSSGSK